MKLFRCLSVLLASALLQAGRPAVPQNAVAGDLLKIEAAVSPKRLVRGQEGKIVLKVRLKKGIVVSALPEFRIEVEGGGDLVFPKTFFTNVDLALPRSNVDGKDCLDLHAPIVIPFSVGPKARRGVYIMHGRVKYFAFDLSGGVCLKSSAKFSTSYSTWAIPVRTQVS